MTDREGYSYDLLVEEWETGFELRLFDGKTWVGKAACLVDGELMRLADIVIFEDPWLGRRGLWMFAPYFLYKMLRGRDYRRRGLGTRLLELVIRRAHEIGASRIEGFVTRQGLVDNPKLLDWYQNHGFRVTLKPEPGPNLTDVVGWIDMAL
jgi:GNAT superfamily N-acetyltransferase